MASQIPFICQRLYEKNLIGARDGNVSERRGDQILITPSGADKSRLQEADLCLIDKDGKALKGRPSGEKRAHLAVYKYQSRARAVVHAHPPCAVALSLARPGWRLLPPALPEIVLALGEVPFVPYKRPGTKALGEALKPFVKKSRALILAHHGAVVWGESLEKAFLLMDQLEHSCKILCLSEAMGNSALLDEKEAKELLAAASR